MENKETISISLANSVINSIESTMKSTHSTQTEVIRRLGVTSNYISSLRKMTNRSLHTRKKSSDVVTRLKYARAILKGYTTVRSVAHRTGYSKRTVRKWVRDSYMLGNDIKTLKTFRRKNNAGI